MDLSLQSMYHVFVDKGLISCLVVPKILIYPVGETVILYNGIMEAFRLPTDFF